MNIKVIKYKGLSLAEKSWTDPDGRYIKRINRSPVKETNNNEDDELKNAQKCLRIPRLFSIAKCRG